LVGIGACHKQKKTFQLKHLSVAKLTLHQVLVGIGVCHKQKKNFNFLLPSVFGWNWGLPQTEKNILN